MDETNIEALIMILENLDRNTERIADAMEQIIAIGEGQQAEKSE